MSNPSKARGTKAETDMLKWLKANGHEDALRLPPMGAKDQGDLTLLTDCWRDGCCQFDDVSVVVEVKHYGRDGVATAINSGLAELDVEMVNAGTRHGVLVVRRNGKTDPAEWLAIRKVRNDPEIGGALLAQEDEATDD